MFRKHGLMCRRTHSAQKPLIAPQSARHWLVLLILLRMTLDAASNTGTTIALGLLIPAVIVARDHSPPALLHCITSSQFNICGRFISQVSVEEGENQDTLKLSFVGEGVSIRSKIIC